MPWKLPGSSILDAVILGLSGTLSYVGLDDLLLATYPRLLEPGTALTDLHFHFSPDIPTITHLLMLAGGVLAFAISMVSLWRYSRGSRLGSRGKIVQMSGLFIAVIAYVVQALDFLGSAGQVG